MASQIDEKYIIECENELGAKLPESYRKPMRNQNGGVVEIDDFEWDLVPIDDSSIPAEFDNSSYHIISETKDDCIHNKPCQISH